MIDADLLHHCVDPRLKGEIAQRFVSEMNAADPFAVRIYQGNKRVLTPPPSTAERAVDIARQWVGRADVRIGVTQYPAGLGLSEPSEITADLFDPCENLSFGTALFGKVLRIVEEVGEVPEASIFDAAIRAYFSGTFEGIQVFNTDDPDSAASIDPTTAEIKPGDAFSIDPNGASDDEPLSEGQLSESRDPANAEIRIDLSRITSGSQRVD